MDKLLKKPFFFITFILLSLFILTEAGILFKPSPAKSNTKLDQGDINFNQQKQIWAERIAKMGPEKAFSEFKQENASRNQEEQHSLAHIFGEALYREVGVSGITTCDASFSFGCYHSFFGIAIADKGPSIVESLNKSCIAKYGPLGTGCQHGIGHGSMEYYGSNRVKEALSLCSSIQHIPLLGCSSGVFMEYNFPTIITGNRTTVTTRSYSDQPDLVCQQIESKFQPSCYFELTAWLMRPYANNFQKIADFCQKLSGANKSACLRGLGNNVAVDQNYDWQATAKVCRSLTGNMTTLYCLAGSGWAFYAIPDHNKQYPLLCSSLSEEDKNKCLKLADLTKEDYEN